MTFRDKLYELRRERGLSQEKLAEHINVSRQTVSKWECGDVSPESDKIVALAKFFSVTTDYLMDDTITDKSANVESDKSKNKVDLYLGLLLLLIGFLLVLVWGALVIFAPSMANGVAASSLITLDGGALTVIIGLSFAAVGAFLLLKKIK